MERKLIAMIVPAIRTALKRQVRLVAGARLIAENNTETGQLLSLESFHVLANAVLRGNFENVRPERMRVTAGMTSPLP